jgi:hypothetical protein
LLISMIWIVGIGGTEPSPTILDVMQAEWRKGNAVLLLAADETERDRTKAAIIKHWQRGAGDNAIH